MKKGFTIIELMIVVAIMMILAAILVPNIQRLFAEKPDRPSITYAPGTK